MSHLPRRTLLAYALAELPLAMAAIPMAIFIPAFYTRDLGPMLAPPNALPKLSL